MESPSKQCVYSGTFIFCKDLDTLEVIDGSLLVDKNGTIVRVATSHDGDESLEDLVRSMGWNQAETLTVKAGPNEFFFPGFIDTHIHAPQYPNAGIFGKTTLLDWLKQYTYPTESSLSDITKAKLVYETCVSTLLAHGTTSAAYYATIHVDATNLLADICKAKGQRALIGRICMDSKNGLVDYYRDEDFETSRQSSIAVSNHVKALDPTGQFLAPIMTPRSAISCTTEQMHMIRDMASDPVHPLRIQTHLSENLSELDAVKSVWPSYRDYTTVYDAHGLLTPRTILAHAIHLDASERKLIADRGAKVSHCPVSNSALGSGMCHVRDLMAAGIVVGLGSDISGGYSPSILEAARHACLVSRLVAADAERDLKDQHATRPKQNQPSEDFDVLKLSVAEALWMATRGGAEVVGWHDRLGAFQTGMQFDAQLVAFERVGSEQSSLSRASNFKVWGWEAWGDIIAKWIYCGDDRNTRKVWVDGVLVHSR